MPPAIISIILYGFHRIFPNKKGMHFCIPFTFYSNIIQKLLSPIPVISVAVTIIIQSPKRLTA